MKTRSTGPIMAVIFAAYACIATNTLAADSHDSGISKKYAAMFSLARNHAVEALKRFDLEAASAPGTNPKNKQSLGLFLLKHRDRLISDIMQSPHQLTSDQTTCASTNLIKSAVVWINPSACQTHVKTIENAAEILVHESTHHLGIRNENQAIALASLVYRSWTNRAGERTYAGAWRHANQIDAEFFSDQSGVVKHPDGIERGLILDHPHNYPQSIGGLLNPITGEWSYFDSREFRRDWPTRMGGRPNNYNFPVLGWTGSEIGQYIFRGEDTAPTDGYIGFLNPITLSMRTSPVPDPRDWMYIEWTEEYVFFWSYRSDYRVEFDPVNAGWQYDIARDTWKQISLDGAPTPRESAKTLWTGSKWIIYGGGVDSNWRGFNGGALYDPKSNTWQPISSVGAPYPNRCLIDYHLEDYMEQDSAIWTGTEMIIWGGRCSQIGVDDAINRGFAYNPTTDTWREISTINAPRARYNHAATWTGTHMVIWGGESGDDDFQPTAFNDGGFYNPVTDTWDSLISSNSSVPKLQTPNMIWINEEMAILGGSEWELGQRYGENSKYSGVFNPAFETP